MDNDNNLTQRVVRVAEVDEANILTEKECWNMNHIHDRGNMKRDTSSLMVPEQMEKNKEIYKGTECKEKPILDEHQLEHNGFVLMEAVEQNRQVWINYYKDYDCHEITGYVEPLKIFEKYVRCTNDDGLTLIRYADLLDVELI